MDIKITVKNVFTKQVELDFIATVVDGADVDYMHKGYSEAYPDSFVNFNMGERGWIAGQPYNMAADERRLEQGLITWEAYSRKWYPTPDEKN
jgi:hypothetical protein